VKEYTVTWTIELHADSPKDAAIEAMRILRDPHSTATVFDVSWPYVTEEGWNEWGEERVDIINEVCGRVQF